MTAHGVIAADAQGLLHARTGMAVTGSFQQRISNLEMLVLQREQIDSRHNNVSTQHGWRDIVMAKETCDCRKMFLLNQRHLARAVSARLVAIAGQPLASFGKDRRSCDHRCAARRPKTDPDNVPVQRRRIQQSSQQGLRMQRLQSFFQIRMMPFCVALCVLAAQSYAAPRLVLRSVSSAARSTASTTMP